MPVPVPKIPIGLGVEKLVHWITANFGDFLNSLSDVLKMFVNGFRDVLLFVPPVLLIIIIAFVAWFISKKKPSIALGTGIGLLIILNLGLWARSMETVALVVSSALMALLIGIPLGIIAAKNEITNAIISPILDFMQTMPPFVYLIPAVIFFGLGNVPGMISTIIFAMPPVIRLTNLGIRQVPRELIEASDAFGSTSMQKLLKVQLPVAKPTIMAGVNQCIMLALSMVVIAAMIGAQGLGYVVLVGIQRIDIGGGFEGGLAIVIIAIILDRITQSLTVERKNN
ncbi:MAG TPA: proline/glycine betaine ABC transporter permease [Clostridia bacterium]|nr:proline/glycine betaine ABC transporter permease [Clostridia bacterium]